MPDGRTALLEVKNIVPGYKKRQVIKGVSIDVAPNEIVALIGHNGAGKTTLLKTIFGLNPIWNGQLYLSGLNIRTPTPRIMLGQGVGYLPQGNRVFTDLTVKENLEIAVASLRSKSGVNEGIERAVCLFPVLKSKLAQQAGTLSGGEKQMLALSNALILSPRLLLLDETSLCLAPALVAQTLMRIRDISENAGAAVLIVEQKVREVLKIADRVYVLRNGLVSFSGQANDLTDETKLRAVYL